MDKEYDDIIEKLKSDYPIENQVSFNEFDLYDKLNANALLIVRYSEMLNKERSHYEYLIELKDKLVGELYDHYRFELDKSLQKVEIEKYYLPKDKRVIKMNKILRSQKARVDFFEICVNGLNKQGWNMKNFSDNMKKGL